jgi:hypothetical protein
VLEIRLNNKLCDMKVLFDSFFESLHFFESENLLVLTSKASSVDYSTEHFLIDNLEAIKCITKSVKRATKLILLNSTDMLYTPTMAEIDAISSLGVSLMNEIKPQKIAIVTPSDEIMASCLKILIQTLKENDYNTQGFQNLQLAREWLFK